MCRTYETFVWENNPEVDMMKIFYEIGSVESSKKLSKLFDFMKEFPDIKDFRKQTILTCLEVCKDVGY